MDWVIPMFSSYKGWAISISNESDNFYEGNNVLPIQMIEFVRIIKSHIHNLNEDIVVSFTMNIENTHHSQEKIEKLLNECDCLCLNL